MCHGEPLRPARRCVGVTFLAASILLTKRAPRPGFLLAIWLGLLALVVSGLGQDSIAEFGAILGAALAWESFDGTVPAVESLEEHLLLGAMLPVFGVLGYLSLATPLTEPVALLLNMVMMAGVVLVPLLVTKAV